MVEVIGEIFKITAGTVQVFVCHKDDVNKTFVLKRTLNYVSVGSMLGVKLIDHRILVLTVTEIYEKDNIILNTLISGIYDEVNKTFKFGTDSFPLINEKVFKLNTDILKSIVSARGYNDYIGKYAYNSNINFSYNPEVLFGKHLGVFGNTGSGKTCTIVSLIQNYLRNESNLNKDIKFIILDVNGEYDNAFHKDEKQFFTFEKISLNHNILLNHEYGRLFKASEGLQYPILARVIDSLKGKDNNEIWHLSTLKDAITKYVEKNDSTSQYSKNQIMGYLNTLFFRIDQITSNEELLNVIDNNGNNIIETINQSEKKVFILDLQVSNDTLDIILFLLFKTIFKYKFINKGNNIKSHICLILEEAHRYIGNDLGELKLCKYYIDKLAREGRKFGIGLIISSQVPSMLSYEIISQCNSLIIHKINNKKDLEFLYNALRISDESLFQRMSSLEKQYAIVSGEAFPSDSLVKVFEANPLPLSNDPLIPIKCE